MKEAPSLPGKDALGITTFDRTSHPLKQGEGHRRCPSVLRSCPNLTRSRLKCAIYPNGEFTIGLDSQGRLPLNQRPRAESVKNMFWDGLSDEGKRWVKQVAAERVSDLGLAIPPNSPKRVRGLNGITSYGARMVRNAAFLMQEKYGKDSLGFVTLTLPKMTKDDQRNVARNWASIVKTYFKEVGRLYERKTGRKFTYVAVTEIQTKRWKRHHDLGLHLHYVYHGRIFNPGPWFIGFREVRDKWQSAVQKFCNEVYDYRFSENCKGVFKDASRYLSKYMSKGCQLIKEVEAGGFEGCLPHSWYSISRRLASAIKRRVSKSERVAAGIVSRIGSERLREVIEYVGMVDIETPASGFRIVGFYGKLQEEFIGKAKHEILSKLNSL